MKTNQVTVKSKDIDVKNFNEFGDKSKNFQLGFLFGSNNFFESEDFLKRLRDATPGVQWVGCSTAGEVSQSGVTENTAIATAIKFDNPNSQFKIAHGRIASAEDSYAAGKKIATELKKPNLKNVILISPGLNVNGSLLVSGVSETLGESVTVTGGLAGDNAQFIQTYTLSPAGTAKDELIAIGFYGENISVQHGCKGGWDAFGKVRKVTKSIANVLYELDGKPALDIYKEYLGAHAKELPGSGLLFPFEMITDGDIQSGKGLIRTILGIDDKAGSLTMAGNIEQGSQVRLMHANTAGLVSGAREAAKQSIANGTTGSSLALIVSCVGRKLVMGANVDEEVESIAEIFGADCALAGFYSYGEISPHNKGTDCELHNQTMTISYIYEKGN